MNLNIDISKDGYKIIQVDIDGKKQYIGSKYNQKREIDKFVESFGNFSINDNYIIFGLSFGEHIRELIKLINENSNVLIIELNEELIRYCRSDINTNEILKDKRIHVTNKLEDIKLFFDNYINEININNIKVGCYCRYDKIYNSKLEQFYKIMKDETTRITSNRNTKLHFGQMWFDSLLDNLEYIVKGTPINDFRDKYKDVPAIIVSAGPSLNKNIDKLKNIDNALIISGGRTLGALCDRDIKVDCLCVVDSAEVSYKLVENYIDKIECPLTFYEGTNSKVVKNHKGKKIFSSNNKFISEIFGQDIQSLSGGGSVAHSMTIMAAYMGCSPIIFIGQDLAYTGEQGHANCAGNRWQSLTFNDYKKDDDIYINDINGNPIRTSILLNRYKLSLENIIKAFPNIEFINATGGGANIEGTKNQTLESALANLKEENVKSLDSYINERNESIISIKKLEDISTRFKDYIDLYFKRKRILQEINPNYNLIEDLNNRLRGIINSLDIIEDLIFKVIYEVENFNGFVVTSLDTEKEVFKKNLNKDNEIFDKIKEVIHMCDEKIKITIEKLNSNEKIKEL